MTFSSNISHATILLPEKNVREFMRLEREKYRITLSLKIYAWATKNALLLTALLMAAGAGGLTLSDQHGFGRAIDGITGVLIALFIAYLIALIRHHLVDDMPWWYQPSRVNFPEGVRQAPWFAPFIGMHDVRIEKQVMHRKGSSEELAGVLWLVEKGENGYPTRRGITWTLKPARPKSIPAEEMEVVPS